MTICVGCRKRIAGPTRKLRLKIVEEAPEFLARAKRLGFASKDWRRDGELEGAFHPNCFQIATVVWEAAFHTRKFSPRK